MFLADCWLVGGVKINSIQRVQKSLLCIRSFQSCYHTTMCSNQNHSWLGWLESKRRNLDVSVDVETIIFAGQHHAPIIHQRDIKTLSMLHLESNILFINASKYFMLRLPDWAPREKEKYLRLVFGIKLKIFSSTDWLLQPFCH